MPLNIARKIPRKSTLSTVPSAEGSNTQEKSASIVASSSHIRQPLQRAATDTTLARKPSDSSVYSIASKVDKKRSAWRGVAKTLPYLLKSRGASSTSLVSQDPEASVPNEPPETVKSSPGLGSKIPVRRMTASPKASLPESRNTPPPKGRDSNER